MYRSAFAFTRNVSNTIGAAGSRQASRQALLYSPFLYPRERYQSTKASNLKKVTPEFWIMKMKTAFAYHDVGGDGYVVYRMRISYHTRMVHTVRVYGTYHTPAYGMFFCTIRVYIYGCTVCVYCFT